MSALLALCSRAGTGNVEEVWEEEDRVGRFRGWLEPTNRCQLGLGCAGTGWPFPPCETPLPLPSSQHFTPPPSLPRSRSPLSRQRSTFQRTKLSSLWCAPSAPSCSRGRSTRCGRERSSVNMGGGVFGARHRRQAARGEDRPGRCVWGRISVNMRGEDRSGVGVRLYEGEGRV